MQPESPVQNPTQIKLVNVVMRVLLSVYAFQAILILGCIFYITYKKVDAWLAVDLAVLGIQVALGIGLFVLGRRSLETWLRPSLNELLAGAQRLVDGPGNQPVAAQPIRELDALAETLNRIGSELAHTREELQRKSIALDDAQQLLETRVMEHTADLRSLQDGSGGVSSGQTYLIPGSDRDELTGLANRTHFMLELSRVMDETAPLGEITPRGLAALLFIDLDQFKVVNDSLGHVAGDRLLAEVAQRLTTQLGSRYLLSRFGGDEFTILMTDARTVREVENLAQKVLEWMRQPFKLEDQDVYCTASIGIAVSLPGEKDAVSLLRDADTAVFRAKANGRNRSEIFSERMHLRARRLLKLEAQIRQAIQYEEFRIYYQPIYSAHDHNITSLEALIRWKHPHQGFLLPQDFIPLAEEAGLIKVIDYWVYEAVCWQVKNWSGNGFLHTAITVNVSGQSIMDSETPAYFNNLLHKYGLTAPDIDLEISEEAAMQHFDTSLQTLTTLRQMGISCWMDDFGQAYSSLSRLRNLPVEVIKIPTQFIRHAEENRAILKAIIDMSHALHLRVCAEGVETQKQAALLDELDCDLLQGYLFAPPLPVPEIEKLLSVH